MFPKVNPGNAVPFLYLGHAYRARGDAEKARKCYQKSFSLDPGCAEAAVALSDVLRDQGGHGFHIIVIHPQFMNKSDN